MKAELYSKYVTDALIIELNNFLVIIILFFIVYKKKKKKNYLKRLQIQNAQILGEE